MNNWHLIKKKLDNKKTILTVLTVILLIAPALPVFAEGFTTVGRSTGESLPDTYYLYDDGSYAFLEWVWIDDNDDGIAECYYFDYKGYLKRNWTSADFYNTNEKGQWVVDGVVQTKPTAEIASTDLNDVLHNGLQMPLGKYEFYASFDSSTDEMHFDLNDALGFSRYEYYEIKANDENGIYFYFRSDNFVTNYEEEGLAKPAMSGAYLSIDPVNEKILDYSQYKLDPVNKWIIRCTNLVDTTEPSGGRPGPAFVYKLIE